MAKKKSVFLSVVLSGLFPGLGQLYCNRMLFGLFFLASSSLCFVMIAKFGVQVYEKILNEIASTGTIGLLAQSQDFVEVREITVYGTILTVLWVVSIVHAAIAARAYNRQAQTSIVNGGQEQV